MRLLYQAIAHFSNSTLDFRLIFSYTDSSNCMTISPLIIFIIYIVGLVLFLVFSIVNLYHVLRFSFMRRVSIIMTSVYFGLILVIVLVTLQIVSNVDWTQSWDISIDLPFMETSNEGFE